MPDNYVDLTVRARDNSKLSLEELKARLDELSHKVATAKVDVGDREAELKLAAMQNKLDQVDRRIASPRITVNGAARAYAQILAVDGALERLDSEGRAGSGGAGGMIGNLLFGLGGTAAGTGLGAALGGVAAEVTALASGIAAAGIGVGAFAALAMPAFKAVSTAYTKITADQLAYNRATTAASRSTALKHIKDDWAALDPAERGALRNLQSFTGEYHKMAKAFEPDAFRVFNAGLRVANKLLPDLKPFADRAATAIDGLLKKLAQAVTPAARVPAGHAPGTEQLTGFQQFLAQMKQLEGPALTAIGDGFGKIGVALGQLLTIMSKKDVVHSINIAFDILAGTIRGFSWFVQRAMDHWDHLVKFFKSTENVFKSMHGVIHGWAVDAAGDFDRVRHDVADWAHNVAAHFDEVRHDVANLAHNIASYFDQARANIARWAGDVGRDTGRVVAWFRGLPGRIMGALGNLGGLLVSAGEALIRGLISGIEGAIPGLTSVIGWVHSLLGGGGTAPGGGLTRRKFSSAAMAGASGGSLSSSVMAGVASAASSAISAMPLIHPHRAPWYGPRPVTNEFVPARGWPQPPRPARITNGAELIAVLADLLRDHSRTHYGGSAQRAYGYGPG